MAPLLGAPPLLDKYIFYLLLFKDLNELFLDTKFTPEITLLADLR